MSKTNWRDVTFGDVQKGYWILVAVIFLVMFAVLLSACGSDGTRTPDVKSENFITVQAPSGDAWECLVYQPRSGSATMHCEVLP